MKEAGNEQELGWGGRWEGCVGGVPDLRAGREKKKASPYQGECHQYIVTRGAWKLHGENTEGSGTDRGLYDRMHTAHLLSHFSCGSVSYEPVEVLGNACI